MFAEPQISGDLKNGQKVMHGGDKNLIVRFYVEAVKNNFQSEKAGRPIYQDVEFVEIMTPGDRNSNVVRKVSDNDKNRFPAQYERFKQNQEMAEDGTPIEQWSMISPSQVQELKHFNIRTVEHVAGLSDAQAKSCGILGMDRLVVKAKAYLSAAEDSALPQKLAGDLAQRDLEIAELRDQVKTLATQLEAMQDKGAKKAK